MDRYTFKSNPAIVFPFVSNEPSPATAYAFRSNPQIDLGMGNVAPRVNRTYAFRSNPAIVFVFTAAGRVSGGGLTWKV